MTSIGLHFRQLLGLALFLTVCLFTDSDIVRAATVPTGFTDSVVASGLTNPTAMAFAPDGRIFVCQQGGALRVIKNGALLATPFVTLTVNASGERGLLGVAFDPNFSAMIADDAVGYRKSQAGPPGLRRKKRRKDLFLHLFGQAGTAISNNYRTTSRLAVNHG